MQLVFLNTLEKRTDEGRVVAAQVSIGESQGRWSVVWTEPGGGSVRTDIWYEGASWEEMLSTFRHGVAVKLGEGYEPVLDGMLEDRRAPAGSYVSMLQCYGELHCREDLYNALREWRRARAAAERKAPYAIARNSLLMMISAFVPQTEEELRQIPGWGKAKSSLYAGDVLAITRGFERRTTFPLTWVQEVLDPKAYRKWLYKQKELRYKSEMERHRTTRVILQAVRDGLGLDELAQTLGMERRRLVERIEQLDREGYDMSPLLDREIARLPEEERERIQAAIREVGDRYLKPILRQVYPEADLEGKPLDSIYEKLRLMRMRMRKAQAREAM
ncbi:MAG: aldolase [Thermobacillus sp. ZCTH02-B1]|uniref:HRDC domain-containing protein n=1 Tax=Thermobacillus sp. ZCTH02-B1 TaxID=1858795 RepID=UPI000B55BE24|nr:HRDC domain-containing protein [Thermobacillus sp. ZCTH02-B1]OUM95412.1 MAG: aldolase [Thermobacillus sp. ZCTH02-B1]